MMRQVMYAVSVLLLIAGTALADIDPINANRQVTLGSGPASERTLQEILDIIYGPGAVNAASDQQSAGAWQLPGTGFNAATPILQFEEAGNRNGNIFGIWSEIGGVRTLVPIFDGPTSPNTLANLAWNLGDPSTVHITGGAGVHTGDFTGINRYWFGFYVQTATDIFYTVDQLNGNGDPQALAYRHGPTDRWVFAFEDRPFGATDRDFNDLVVSAESIVPTPEPGAVLLLGVMMLGSLPVLRRLRK